MRHSLLAVASMVLLSACGAPVGLGDGSPDAGAGALVGDGGGGGGATDAGAADGGAVDAGGGAADAGAGDGGAADAGGGATDAGARDGGTVDAGSGTADGGARDGGAVDAGSGTTDGGSATADAGSPFPGGCVSGATGHYAARFHWAGSGSSSPAYVQYDLNNLPDHSRWRAGAYSRGGIGYQPVFTDIYLGAGGLDLGSSVFIDVELSTANLSTIRQVTLALKGRSFSTTSSGSFNWLSFDGAGATPSGFVSNVAPYRWYLADATDAFTPGNGSVLLRISPDAPSYALVVNSVEICVDGE